MSGPPLRIGILAPISHPIPPPGYGPWERVCHDLTEGLVDLGHQVTLLAPADSRTSAELAPTVAHPIGPDDDARLMETLHIALAVSRAIELELDVIHSHLHVHVLGYAPLLPMPLVTTLHGVAWNRANHPILEAFAQAPFVSLTDSERKFLPSLNYVATVNNGIRLDDFPVGAGGERLVFVGRMAPEKAPDQAIEVAQRTDRPLVLAGGIEDRYRDFFESRVRPGLGAGIEYVGALSREDVARLMGSAAGLLMPLRWDEPFGLVVAEALAVGTPVIGWRRGALPELIQDGVTGFLVDNVEEATAAVRKLAGIDRGDCRAQAERRFSHHAMAKGYAQVYRRLISSPT